MRRDMDLDVEPGRHRAGRTLREQLVEIGALLLVLVIGIALVVVSLHWIWEAL